MTAKDKAQQIYDKIYNGMESGVPKKYVLKCATILVDEMIDYLAEKGIHVSVNDILESQELIVEKIRSCPTQLIFSQTTS